MGTPLTTPSDDAAPSGDDVDVTTLFSPYERVSPPFNARERVSTVLAAVVLLPIRVVYLLFCGALLWLASLIAMSGMRDKTAFLFSPVPAWRKAFLASLTPILRSMLFVAFGIYHIERREAEYDSSLFDQGDPRLNSSDPSKEPAERDFSTQGGTSEPGELGKVHGSTPPKSYVIVANHLGYIDIIVLLGMFRGAFVAKGAIEKVPFIGTIATALQCMFVREGEPLTSQLISRVETTYRCHAETKPDCPGCGSCMNKLVIFPEGTTCNGNAMVPFRTGVFNAGLPVKPVCIDFPVKHFNLSWETIRFREHLFRSMTQWRNRVVVTDLPVYVPSASERADARLYAFNVQRQMAKVLGQPIVPLNRKHKFLYHSYLTGKVTNKQEVRARAEQLYKDDPLLQYVVDKAGANCEV